MFPQETQSPDGSTLLTNNTLMEVFFIEKTPAVYEEIQRAIKLNSENNNKECLNMLMQLYDEKKIYI